jgi:hypothetical protein
MAPIGPRHQSIVDQLTEEFSTQNKGRYKVSSGRPIPIPDFNEPQPDMVLFKRGVPTERHPSPNEIYLVVKVSETTLKQDEGKKLLAYQNAGIPEYWIVDVAAKVVRIHRLNQAKPTPRRPTPKTESPCKRFQMSQSTWGISFDRWASRRGPRAGHPRFSRKSHSREKLSTPHNPYYVEYSGVIVTPSYGCFFSRAS